MNNRPLFLLALGFALLLHFLVSAPLFMQKKSEILHLQNRKAPATAPTILQVQQLPLEVPEQEETAEETESEEEESSLDESAPDERSPEEKPLADKPPIDEPPVDEALPINEEYTPEVNDDEPLLDEIEPPLENERYSRVFVADAEGERELMKRAAAALNATPYLSDEWFKDALFEDKTPGLEEADDSTQPDGWDSEEFDTESLSAEEVELHSDAPSETVDVTEKTTESAAEELKDHTLAADTLIVTFIDLAELEALEARIKAAEEAEKEAAEVRATANLIAAVKGGNIQPPDEIESIAKECYPQEMAKLGRGKHALILILENPLRVALYQGSGISKLDNCALQIADKMIRDPQEINAIRRGAPRINGGYLIRATF